MHSGMRITTGASAAATVPGWWKKTSFTASVEVAALPVTVKLASQVFLRKQVRKQVKLVDETR